MFDTVRRLPRFAMKISLCLRALTLGAALLVGASVLSLPAPAFAQEAAPPVTLKVGDAAPALAVSSWWADKKLDGLQKNRVYLVDFWASWCPPCRESFPDLAKMKAKYGSEGLEVVAISIDDDPNDAAKFLTEQGSKFDFFVGVDKDSASWNTWGHAAGRNSIPTTFLVDASGKIAWVGHPLELEEEAPLLKCLEAIPLDQLPTTPKK